MNKEQDQFMKDYAKTSELSILLDDKQKDAFYHWKESNNINELETACSPTTVSIYGKGWIQGVCIGELSITFVNSKGMKETYKKELARGFAEFVRGQVDKTKMSARGGDKE